MTEFKVGDKVKVLVDYYNDGFTAQPFGSWIGPMKGDVIEVKEICNSPGMWIDSESVELTIMKAYMSEFELVEEEKVKNRFTVGDKVISIIDVTGVPEGYIGHVVKIRDKLSFPIVVRKEGTNDERVFNEDELELLSVGGKEKIPQLKEEARIIFDGLVDKDHPFNRDDITPQDIAGVSKSALDKQIGGGHYKEKGIQPIEYIFANNLGFCEANIVKYATRWKDKNGIQDLEKIIHYTELLIELTKKEESKDKEGK